MGGGVERDRVAELIVETRGGGQRGSGYRVIAGTVLTAAHVVMDAVSVGVRFNADLPDEWTASATVECADPAADVAALSITPRGTGEDIPGLCLAGLVSGLRLSPVRQQGFPGSSYATIHCPRFRADSLPDTGTATRRTGPFRRCRTGGKAVWKSPLPRLNATLIRGIRRGRACPGPRCGAATGLSG
jgi:trypsin-like peptidase